MNAHKNARTTPHIRALMVRCVNEEGRSVKSVAPDLGVSDRTVRWFRKCGIGVKRVMINNGSCYKAATFAKACRRIKARHVRTKPYTPRTNGKAERFIQTMLRKWAYALPNQSSNRRNANLQNRLRGYNFHRPHASLKNQPPVSRLKPSI